MKRDKSNSNAPDRAGTSTADLTRAAAISITVILVAGIVVFIIELSTILISAVSLWQDYAALAVSILIPVASYVGLRFIRRGNTDFGVHMVLGSLYVILTVLTCLHSGFGLVFSISLVAATLAIAGQTLPAHKINRIIIISVAVGGLIVLIDSYWPFVRSAPPAQLAGAIPIVAIGMVLFFFVTVIRQFQSYPLQTKLLLAFFLVALLPLSVLAISNDNAERTFLTNTANQSLNSAATRIANEIDSFFNTETGLLKVEADLPSLIDFLHIREDFRSADSPYELQISGLLAILAQDTPLPITESEAKISVPTYLLLDGNGKVVASNDRARLNQNQADQPYFTNPIQTRALYISSLSFTGQVHVADIYMATPVLDAQQNIVGVFAARFDTNWLQAITAGSNNIAGPQSFGMVFDIVDQNYIHIAHGLEPYKIGMVVGQLDNTAAQKLQSLNRIPGGAPESLSTNLTDLNNHLLNISAQPDFAAADIGAGAKNYQVAVTTIKSGQPWLVAFFQPQDVFLEPANIQTQNTIKLALAISVLVAAAAVGGAQVLTGPIVRLTSVVTHITAGDLSARARIETGDEIGALAIGVNKMAVQLQDLIGSLEKRIEARTEQLKASAEVGRVAASILDTEHLLREVVQLITARFGFYYAAIFLTDDSQHWAVLHEATGEAGRILKERQHKLEIGGQSMVGYAIVNRLPRIALDVGTESTRFANPLLPETRSEIALPLIVGDHVLGALDVQSTQVAAFDVTYASVLQSMADQIAIALSNTQQFTRTESALRQSNILYEANRQIAAANNANDILQAIVTQAAPDTDRATLVLFGPANEDGEYAYLESIATYAKQVERVSIQAGQRYEVNQLPLISMVAPDKPAVIENITRSDIHNKRVMRILNTKAAVGLSLTTGPKNLGAIVLGYRQPRHFSTDELQTLQTLANQAAVSLQNQQLLAETQNTLKQLDAINRRLTGEAWQTFTQNTGGLQTVAAGPGVSALNAARLQEVAIDANQVKALGPIGDARSALIAPIALRGQVIGSLSLQETNAERQWTENEMTLLQTVANDVAVAIDNARLIEQTERRAERERIIIDVNSRMLAANDLQSIVHIAGEELARALNVARAKVHISAEFLQSAVEQDTRVI